jgi:hypothetical protein
MQEIDLYTITEALGDTCQPSFGRELPLLHNLLHVNKDCYKGSLNRYKREECHMPVRYSEIIRYFKTKPSRLRIFVIILDSDTTRARIVSNALERRNNHTYISSISKNKGKNSLYFPIPSFNVSFEDCIKMIDKLYTKYQFKTTVIITFDICTLYNIVKLRKHCLNIVNNYAQNYVKTSFNKHMYILSDIKLTPALNFYISSQCKAAQIERDVNLFLVTEGEKGDFKTYSDRTCAITKSLIEKIMLFIERDIKFIS